MANTRAGVRQLDPRKPLPWEIEEGVPVPELPVRGEKPTHSLVRFRIFGRSEKNNGKILLVFNADDTTGIEGLPEHDKRPPGWGIPGGTVEGKETPLQALEHEKGEIPFEIEGDPREAYHFFQERSKTDPKTGRRIEWTEAVCVFDVDVDENKPIKTSAEEGQEISMARFFSFEEVRKMQFVDTRHGAIPEPDPEKLRIYISHKWLVAAWEEMAKQVSR